MEKAVVNMINWKLHVYDDKYNLSGIADSHPKLGKYAYVGSTSPLVNYKLVKDILTYETCNTIYVCPLKYMKIHPYKNVLPEYIEKLTHRADDSDNCLDQIIAVTAKIATDTCNEDAYVMHIKEIQKLGQQEIKEIEEQQKEMEKQNDARLCDIVKNYKECIYIEVSNIDSGSKLAYHLGDYLGIVLPRVHYGMFQDSVLYRKHGFEKRQRLQIGFSIFSNGRGNGYRDI